MNLNSIKGLPSKTEFYSNGMCTLSLPELPTSLYTDYQRWASTMKKRREKEGNAEQKGTKRKCKGEYSSLRVNIANKREINQKGCMKSTIQ